MSMPHPTSHSSGSILLPPGRWQIAAAVTVGCLLALLMIPLDGQRETSPKGVIVERVLSKVKSSYVDDVDLQRLDQLFYDGVDEMVRQLDRNTRYVRPKDVLRFEGDTEGTYIGIGIVLSQPDPVLPRVKTVIDGGPADAAGLLEGDVVLAIDGVAIEGQPLTEITERIKGRPGTAVALQVERGAGRRLDLNVARGKVETSSIGAARLYPTAPGRPQPLGYLRLIQFQERTSDEIYQTTQNLIRAGATGMVIDLRYNGGGVLQEAVEVVRMFTTEGHILTTRGRSDLDKPNQYRTEHPGPFADLPLVLLVDGNSASASEIVAAALRDHQRALLVGTETYGKWTVQTIFPLGEAAVDGMLKLTTRRHYPPQGLGINRDEDHARRGGLLPDLEVALSAEDDTQLHRNWQEEKLARINRPMLVDVIELDPASQQPVDLLLIRGLELLANPTEYRRLIAEQRLRWQAQDTPAATPTEVAREGEPAPRKDGQ